MFFGPESTGTSGSLERRRLIVLTAFAGMAFLCLAVRLFHLQIIRGADMWRLAEQNRTQVIPLSAPRGRILDRGGVALLDNAPRFSLFYSSLSIQKKDIEPVQAELNRLFPASARVIERRLSEARQTGKMTRILAGLPREKALGLIERRVILPGVQVVVEPQRRSRFGTVASHVIGYVDEITPHDIKKLGDSRLRAGQFIGRMGVERLYDNFLRGVDGGLQFEMDARGRHLQVLRRITATPGNDIILTIDRGLQAAAERGLDQTISRRGAVVAVDPATGEILALVSHPGFDPAGELAPLMTDPALPLFNRVLQGSYPSGSVFKSVTALGALRAGWDTRKTYFCSGVFKWGNKEFKCWKRHGVMDFWGAMAWSCDVYYYNMGLQVGVDSLEELGKALGLGQRTGIDLTSEAAGNMPGREWKTRVQRQPWYEGDTVNLSIGQGFLTVTPLQTAMWIAALANNGTLWRPRVVDKVVSPEGKVLYRSAPEARNVIRLTPEVWEGVHRSLQEVVQRGTGGGAFRPDLLIGGKTGTAQNPHGEDHAWFAAYAGRPGGAPSLVVVGFVENGGHGSDAALPVVREVLREAFPLPEPPAPRTPPVPAPMALPTPAAPAAQ